LTVAQNIGMDQAAIIDHVRSTGVSDSPSLAYYIFHPFAPQRHIPRANAMHYDKSDDFKR
jgi:hypothetical protein